MCRSRAEVLVCFNFVSLPHIHPSLERLWGACRGRKASKREPGDIPETTPDVPNRLLGVPLGCLWEAGPPEGGRGPQGDNPGDSKWASRCKGAQVKKKHSKMMSRSLCRNVHAVEVRSPYWSKEGAGRTRITTARRQIQTYAKRHGVENVHAVEATSPF